MKPLDMCLLRFLPKTLLFSVIIKHVTVNTYSNLEIFVLQAGYQSMPSMAVVDGDVSNQIQLPKECSRLSSPASCSATHCLTSVSKTLKFGKRLCFLADLELPCSDYIRM